MTANEWWMVVGGALVIGTALGGALATHRSRSRASAEVRRLTLELEQRGAATAEHLRSAQAAAKRELEQERAAFKRQLAQAVEVPRAAAARAEDRLRAAYDELERTRVAARGPELATADVADSFAETRPMRQGM